MAFLFGGQSSSGLNDTWMWDGRRGTWTQVVTSTSPPAANWQYGMAYDSLRSPAGADERPGIVRDGAAAIQVLVTAIDKRRAAGGVVGHAVVLALLGTAPDAHLRPVLAVPLPGIARAQADLARKEDGLIEVGVVHERVRDAALTVRGLVGGGALHPFASDQLPGGNGPVRQDSVIAVQVPAYHRPPFAAARATVSGLTAHLEASTSAGRDGGIASHAWDFGDGSTGSGAIVDHSYAHAGTYTVRLTATDDAGKRGFTQLIVSVG